ncbi:hypothetical protein D3C84_530470 [compost metagenome]
MQVLLRCLQRGQLLGVLVETHTAGAVAVLIGQLQALLVKSIIDAVLLVRQPTLPVTLAKTRGRAQSLLPKRINLLLQRAGVRIDRESLFTQSPLFVGGDDRQLAVAVLLSLDHGGAGIGDLLVNLDDLGIGCTLLGLGRFERFDLRLIALGNFVSLLLQQTDPLLCVTGLADHPGTLGRFQLLVCVFVVGQRFGQGILRVVETSGVDTTCGDLRVLELIVDVRDVLGDCCRIKPGVFRIDLPDIVQAFFVVLDRFSALLLIGQ